LINLGLQLDSLGTLLPLKKQSRRKKHDACLLVRPPQVDQVVPVLAVSRARLALTARSQEGRVYGEKRERRKEGGGREGKGERRERSDGED
jgi:hypothetical protein